MLPGYLLAADHSDLLLTACYFVHWIASFMYHLHPDYPRLMTDIHFIDAVTMERLYHLTGSIWVYPLLSNNIF